MKHWLRITLPPSEYVAAYFITYLFVAGLIYWFLGWEALTLEPENASVFGARDAVVAIAVAAYGGFRAIAFQPAYRREYLQFLKQTAWTADKPLPLGPIHLVWQDVAVAALLIIMMLHHAVMPPARIVQFGLFAYLLCVTPIFMQFRMWRVLYPLLAIIGLAVLFWSAPLLSVGILFAAYWLAFGGMDRVLAAIDSTDFDGFPFWSALGITGNNRKSVVERLQRLAGWPFDDLAPHKPAVLIFSREVHGIPAHHGVMISLMFGWWLFAVSVPILERTRDVPAFDDPSSIVPPAVRIVVHEIDAPLTARTVRDSIGGFLALNVYVVGALALGRISFYFKGHHPPIDLAGRLRMGRLIIPAYDVIFVSPICILLAAFLLPPLLVGWIGVSPLFAAPATLIATLFCTFNIGPRRVDWLLTAPCRMVPSLDYKNKQVGEFSDS